MRLASTCLLTSLLVTSCGFRPLHQAVTPALADAGSPLRSIVVDARYSDDAENKRAAFMVAQSLRDRIGDGDAASRYTLRLTPRVTRSGLAVGRDDVASRFDLNIYTSYTLSETATGAPVLSGRTYSVATFGAPIDPYGRIAAEVNATEQASEQAADRILTDLAVHFAGAPATVPVVTDPSDPVSDPQPDPQLDPQANIGAAPTLPADDAPDAPR